MTAAHTASGLGPVAQAQAGREATGMEACGPRPRAELRLLVTGSRRFRSVGTMHAWLTRGMRRRRMSLRMLRLLSGVGGLSRLARGQRDPRLSTVQTLFGVLGGRCPVCGRETRR